MISAIDVRAGSKFKPQNKWIILLCGLIAGSLFGLCIWYLLFTNSQGFALVSIGRFDNSTPRPDQPAQANWIEEPQVVVERMRSLFFAEAIAERAHLPELSSLLPAKPYGGGGGLSVRALRDPNLLEIKITARTPEIARTAIDAVVEELVSEHAKRVEPLLRDFAIRLQSINELAVDARKSHDRLAKLLDGLPQDPPNAQQTLTLIALKSVADSNLATVEKAALEVETAVSSQATRNTRIIQPPATSRPTISSLWRTMALSAVAGLILALVYLHMRTERSYNHIKDDEAPSSVRP